MRNVAWQIVLRLTSMTFAFQDLLSFFDHILLLRPDTNNSLVVPPQSLSSKEVVLYSVYPLGAGMSETCLSLSLCLFYALFASHCLSLPLSLSLSALLIIASLCHSLRHFVSRCLSLSLLVSRCLSLPQVASICLSLPLVASLCLLLSFFASHCFSLPLSASRCLFRKRMKAILFDNVLLAIVDREGLWWGSLKLALHEVSIAITVSGRVFTPCNECTEIDSRERLLEFLRDRSWVFSSE